jgi:uncharacterized protein
VLKNSIKIHVIPSDITPVNGHINRCVNKKYNIISPTSVAQKEKHTVQDSTSANFAYIFANTKHSGFVIIETGHASPFSTIRIANDTPNRTLKIV